jgi:hypothetical protein
MRWINLIAMNKVCLFLYFFFHAMQVGLRTFRYKNVFPRVIFRWFSRFNVEAHRESWSIQLVNIYRILVNYITIPNMKRESIKFIYIT